ncbi:hypothetical protein GCK72_003373 [Caenorhabditis remanei]|uniref:Uncharacterized protein n=1 Tax=Caenorhabditis remanei TaxID=31234 RepID=A0A6A5HX46_CAERE|nr:hypothetical protein GCK72_003373 [Caenorhabditis remanei]KAF1771546.1 hypothetical protein GCK72_003373 [Caenorhabditis remanei]
MTLDNTCHVFAERVDKDGALAEFSPLFRAPRRKMLRNVSILLVLLAAGVAAKHVELPAPYKDHCILDDKQNLYDPSRQFDIKWTTPGCLYERNISPRFNFWPFGAPSSPYQMNRLGGHEEEYQEILDYMENIAVEGVGELPASVEGRDLVDIYFNYLLEVLDNHY